MRLRLYNPLIAKAKTRHRGIAICSAICANSAIAHFGSLTVSDWPSRNPVLGRPVFINFSMGHLPHKSNCESISQLLLTFERAYVSIDLQAETLQERKGKMNFTDSQMSFISQALVLAADKYVAFAVDCATMRNSAGLQTQFLKQAKEIRHIAMLFGDADSASVQCFGHGMESEASAITDQQFADSINERAITTSAG